MKRIIFLIMISLTKVTSQEVIVHATVYNAVPEQTNSDPKYTAFMFKLDLLDPFKHRIIAVSRDLLKQFPNRTQVYLSGVGIYNGVYTVRDKMNRRYTKRIDILINKDMGWISVKNAKIKLIK